MQQNQSMSAPPDATPLIPHSRPTLGEEDVAAVVAALRSGQVAAGPVNADFAAALGRFVGLEHVALYSSGTSALFHALRAVPVRDGDDVLLPAYVCGDVLRAVCLAGGRPVLYDNAPGTWVTDLEQVRLALTPATKAIILCHTFGMRVHDLEALIALGVPVLADCGHALAAHINDKPIARLGLCAVYSFQATKCLATGEGGAVATADPCFFERLRAAAIDDGLADLNCALGLSQLRRYEGFLRRRREIAEFYFAQLAEWTKPLQREDSLYFRFPIQVEDPLPFFRSRVLYRRGVDALLCDLPGLGAYACPNARQTFARTVSLPIYPSLTNQQAATIVAETKRLLGVA